MKFDVTKLVLSSLLIFSTSTATEMISEKGLLALVQLDQIKRDMPRLFSEQNNIAYTDTLSTYLKQIESVQSYQLLSDNVKKLINEIFITAFNLYNTFRTITLIIQQETFSNTNLLNKIKKYQIGINEKLKILSRAQKELKRLASKNNSASLKEASTIALQIAKEIKDLVTRNKKYLSNLEGVFKTLIREGRGNQTEW
ncbi:MAG: hypothetical protein JW725_01370 [Candidatus Babeliaceae bacterium]|nr:hypothetical protein [Candidatus Babeliaceae bacterium]